MILRCAIYTRKSSEEGLEQEFNSLHAQRDACAAYIASQKHEGWQPIKTHYDDGGFSGGNMERPALKQLLEDIAAEKVNIVVVYKVDRLSRSLHDFARMVDVFDKHNVSFVSVTQQFNTTTSMGRLTLNVLLSFAQFEREVTGERIRDKIAASKKKGMWMGGFIPLGYNLKDRQLLINFEEAKTVQHIYRRYLELGCVRLLQEELVTQGVRSKSRQDSVRPGGGIISRGALYKILSNPIYIGQIRHKGICHPGQHEAIIDQMLWNKVQQHMAGNAVEHKIRLQDTAPLNNKLFDASGERLRSAHSTKRGRRYRYYASLSLLNGTRAQAAGGWRLPGQEIEQVVAHEANRLLKDRNAIISILQEARIAVHHIPAALATAKNAVQSDAASLIRKFVQRVELRQDSMRITFSLMQLVSGGNSSAITTRDIPMKMKRRGVEMRLVIGDTGPTRMDSTLIKVIARAHGGWQDVLSGMSITAIAARDGIDRGDVNKRLVLAFLAPEIVESIITGRQPADLLTEKLVRRVDLPLNWAEQKRILGYN
jgi:DNA invertase Pin-like site-specific DNA recombinase